jgi:hypothetical protein
MKRVFFTTLLLFTILLNIAPAAAQSNFEDLVTAVKQKDDVAALKIAESLESRGERSFGLYYNRGLAYRDQGRFAQARSSFETALTYAPRDLPTRRRLREVKEKLSPQTTERDVKGTPVWTRSEAEVALGLIAALALFAGLARLVGWKVSPKQSGVIFTLLLLTATVLALGNPPSRRAVVVSGSANLLGEPRSDATGPVLPEGVLVEVVGEKSHYRQIRLGDGQTGWVRGAELSPLKPEAPTPKSDS